MSRQDDPPPSFAVRPQTPIRQPRHRSSLEHIFNFTLSSPQLNRADREEAFFFYNEIVQDCESAGIFVQVSEDVDKVYVHNLLRALLEFAPKEESRLNIVRMILHGLFSFDKVTSDDRTLTAILPLARAWHRGTKSNDLNDNDPQPLYKTLQTIAADFLLGFFVPFTAQATCTPHVSGILSPSHAFGVARTQGTPNRLRDLRRTCLLRDGNRCVISGHLDMVAHTALRKLGHQQPGSFGILTQAAHIIPHSLNAVKTPGEPLSSVKTFVWQILNMFDTGISSELEGSRIDAPYNAMILAAELHQQFGQLQCYLDEVAPDTYTFRRTSHAATLAPSADPKAEKIAFVNHEPVGTSWADLPSARLLKLHAACCKMMEMAGAAEYVEYVVRDLERLELEGTLAGDGSSDISMLLKMKGLWSGFSNEEVEEQEGGEGGEGWVGSGVKICG